MVTDILEGIIMPQDIHLKRAMNKRGPQKQLSKKIQRKLQNLKRVKKELSNGKTAQEVLEVSDQEMLDLYLGAKKLFDSKKYLDSADAFLFLVTLNPHSHDYWMGFGTSLQLCGEIEGAIQAYEMASILQVTDPTPYLYLAKCLLELKEREATLQALDLAIECCQDLREYRDLKNQAIQAKKLLERADGSI